MCLIPIFAGSLLLAGCIQGSDQITSISQLKEPGRIIAVSDGTPEEKMVREDFSEGEILPFSDLVAAYTAVKDGKADACVHSRNEMTSAISNGFSGVHLLDDTYCVNTVAVGISRVSPVPDLQNKINTFLRELKDNGTLDDMYDRWVVKGNDSMPDIPVSQNNGMTLRVATTGSIMPYSFYIGTELAGYDIELAKRFGAWLGADIEFSIYDFGGIIASAQAGDVDCIMSDLYYTEEHAEAIDFSDPVMEEYVTVMVKDSDSGFSSFATALSSFPDSVASSFEKTFIREERWKLLLQGTCTTIIITVLSVLFGTLLGFSVYMTCRKGNPVANTITRFCIRLVQGMPVVVLLMILYYIVFGSLKLSGTIVSVICFTLIFGSAVYSMLKAGVGTVDRGQAEAAYALGYKDNRLTFFHIILPQALPHIKSSFIEQITALIKATAIVGYIAVQDLTKMGDIIRNRTYEAFFPLITVAVIYFVLIGILTALVRRISRLFDTKKLENKRLLKGVKFHD